MRQIKAERDAADAEVERWEAAARAVADKAAQGESAAVEEQAQTVDDSKTEELAATDAEERASGSGEQNPQEAESSERGGGTDEYQAPKEADFEKTIYTEQELENLYRRFNEQQKRLFAIREEMRQLLGGTSMEDYKKADAERRAKADELIAQHNEIRQSISHNDLKVLSIYLWRRLGKLMKEVDGMEGDTPRALGDELNRLSNDHSSVTRALRDYYDDSNLYHVGVKAEAEQTDKADAKADAPNPFDTDRVREQREVFLSVEETRKEGIEYFRRADKNGGLRLATGEKRNEDDEDDPDAVETKMYVPVYTVSYFGDMNSSSDPQVREYDTVDEALANMRYDYELSDSDPYSQLEVKFKEVWVDKDGDVIEEDDDPRSLYDIAREVKLPDEMQQYEGEDSIILHDEAFTTGKELNEEKEEEIRDEIEKVLRKETYVLDGKEVHLKVGSLGKYTDIEVLDADGESMGSFTLRIADHSYNPRNNTTAQLAGNFISVVVNYDDPTAEKFHGRYNIYAGIDDSADSVADEVNERVQEIINEWDADKDHPRYSLVTPESEMTVQEQEAALRDALVGKLQDAGIEVVTDSEQAQRVINEANGEARLQASLGGLKKASDFILSFLKGGTRQRSSKFEIPERANRLAEKAIGHKINSHTINANELTHAKKRHGVNGSANTENSIPLRDEDFSLMPYIMSAPTRGVKGSMSSNGTESVRYEKDLSNGVVIVVEREGRFDVSDMENITMWAQKKSATNVTVAQRASHSTSETIVISEADAAKIRKDAEDAIRNDEKMRKHKINLYYNPRFSISPVRGEWTKDKIIKRLKDIVGAKTGYSFAARRIAEFDSAEELANHMFYHGTQYGGGRLKPSILMSDREIERIGGGGYGEKYWGVSVSKSKRVASNFSIGRSVRIYPVILVKNAKVKDMPELKDAADLDDCIVDLWKEGVDAVWIGDKNRGEQELCVLNPAAIVNIDTPDVYQNYKLGTPENPLTIIDSDGISKLYEDSKRYVNALEKKPIKPMKPSRFMPTEDGETLGALKSDEQYQQEMSEYESRLDEYNNSDEVRLFNEEEYYASRNIRFFRTPGGEAYGFTVGGRIYVDTRIATAETPIHEYAHLWATALRQTNPAEWQNVVELMKGTGIWDSVRAGYPELTSDDEIADEVLAHYSGRRGAERLREAQREALAGDGVMTAKLAAMEGIRRVREALERFWRGVADFLGIHFTTAEEVADKVLSDLLHGMKPGGADSSVRFEENAEIADIVARAKADGTYLKAPNGKPSNLSPRQWAQVRTKAFKDWFGNWELAQKVLNIVAAVKEHGFKNFADAKAWANDNIVRTLTNEETGGKGEIRISNNAVSKFLSESAVAKSESKDVHLSVLKVLPDVIRESVDAEQHPDYKKGADGNRSSENGVNENVTIHRLYGAVEIDGKTYRVKVTLKEYTDSNRPQKAYSYEATKIELLAGTLVGGKTSNPSTNNSISAANLLKGVEKSDGSGEKLLDCSKVVDGNGEPMVVYHGTKRSEKINQFFINSHFGTLEQAKSRNKGKIFRVFLNIRNPERTTDQGVYWDYECKFAKLRGADGLVYKNEVEGDGDSYVAFSPTQIKSATDNVGTFSSQNPDIRYQFIGEKGARAMGMAEEARRASLASETEDVAREDQIFLFDGLGVMPLDASLSGSSVLEAVNKRFNEELQQQIDGTLPKGHVYQLGLPGAVLRAAGFPNAPIELSSTRLAEKAGQRNHQFDISDIKSLPKALSEPMAVFRYGDKSKAENVIVSIERDGKQFVVGVHFNQGRHGIIVSDVRGLFNKNNAEWLNWISQGKAEYLDKEKIQVLIDKQRTNLAEVEYLNLEDVAKVVENFVNPSVGNEKNGNISEDTAVYRIREDAPPAKTGVGYKVFVLKNGKLYPPMVANPGGEATPVGVWLDADAAPVAGMTKTGRQQVKAGGKGTQGGSGKLAYRPGWHLGEIPYALQFNRLNPETGQRELFPADFVWAEVEYADDVNYQEEAMSYGMNANGKFQHSLAGLPRLPKNGSYKYRTNPDPNTDAWVITGAMKVNRILKPSEVDAMVEAAGREPQRRQNDAVTDEQIDALNREIESTMKKDASMKRKTAEQMGARLHTPVNIIETAESVTHPDPEGQARRRNAKGWYDPASGQVNIVIGNNANVDDVAATVFHEVVAHKGLREMIGRERYDEFLDEIYDHLRASTKKAVDADAARMFANEPLRGYRQHRRVAMDELLGQLAEKGFEDFTAEEQGIWERLKEKVIEAINGFLGALKLPKWVRLGDNELRYILWRSHEQMRSRDGEVDAVRDEAKREALGLEPTQEDILFRTKGNKEYNGDKVLWDNNLSIYDNLMAYVMREAESVNGEAAAASRGKMREALLSAAPRSASSGDDLCRHPPKTRWLHGSQGRAAICPFCRPHNRYIMIFCLDLPHQLQNKIC